MSGGAGIFGFLVTMVGLQGVLEALICCAAGGAISKAVSKALKKE